MWRWNAGSRWALAVVAASWLAVACEDAASVPARPAALPAQSDAHEGRTEAERLVSDELARLRGVEQAQIELATELTRRREITRERRDSTLGWQRRIREGKAAPEADPRSLDDLYDELIRSLRSARAELASALERPTQAVVPHAGPDPLQGLDGEPGVAEVRDVRARVESEAHRLQLLAEGLGSEARAQLALEVDTLNRERLGLLAHLSPYKREAIMGFTPQGLEQAGAELRHVRLVASYHRRAFRDELYQLDQPGKEPRHTVAELALLAGEVVLVLAIYFAWRRLARALLEAKLAKVRERNRRLRLSSPARGERLLELLGSVHTRAAWLILWLVLFALLPPGLRAVRTLQLIDTVLTWLLGGAVVVTTVNALAGSSRMGPLDDEVPALRLRSLRLVGGVVIVFGLALTLSARQLGHGTIYSWVSSSAWFAAVPVFLILVSWWRGQVFQRIAAQAEKTALESWILRERRGYQKFFAAMAGSVILFASGSFRAIRRWLVGFDLTRRALAYLFRRQLGKLRYDDAADAARLQPLDAATYERLGPATASAAHIPTELELALSQRAQAIRAERGGVLAVVSERGMGKTTALRRLRELVGQDAISIDLASGGPEAAPPEGLLGALRARLGLPERATLEEAAAKLDGANGPTILLVDNAQRLIRPVIGGLKAFDAVVAAARNHSHRCTWVFAFNDAVWPFLKRARGVCPLFDDVIRVVAWRESEIAKLLQARSAALSLAPSFEYLLDEATAQADENERQAALTERANGYYRLIWDHAGGNPGVALDIWRRALGVDAEGRSFVRLFPSLNTVDLERLPDPAAFVLRAVLQMAPATPDEIERATLLTGDQVGDALRYSLSRGFVQQRDDGYQVTWTWLRPVSRYLQRKHLLVAS